MLTSTQAANSTEPVTIAGKTFPVRQLKFHEWADLQSWLKSVCPSPVAVAIQAVEEMAAQGIRVSKETRQVMFEQAQEESRRWPPKIGSRAWLQALDDIEGAIAQFIRVAIASGGTSLSEVEANDLAQNVSIFDMGNLIRVCLHGEYPIPKPTMIPTGSTTESTPMNGERSSSISENSGQPGPTEILSN